jgi:phenylpropionate dioxygenase-like ring-hydroxylating dioxygenase large terminal subunit
MFLRNAWYAAAWGYELEKNTTLARTLLGEKVVLFRTQDGKPYALEDRCSHRAAPLSLGEVVGETIACGYHGLRFNHQGKCVLVPGQDSIPAKAGIRSYPIVERWTVIWIWMGDPAKCDEALIPSLNWLDSPEWSATPGYIYLKANYQLLVDNLLDLTHVSYVHRKTISGDPREATTPTRVEPLPDGVRVGRWMIDFVPPPLFKKVGNFETNVDRWQWVTWKAPSTVYLDVGCATTGTGAPEGDRSQGITIWSNHLITPETEETSHYMFCFARNFDLSNSETSKLLYEGSKATFLEDAVILEAEQKNLKGGDITHLVDLAADAAQLRARRMLKQLIEKEQLIE